MPPRTAHEVTPGRRSGRIWTAVAVLVSLVCWPMAVALLTVNLTVQRPAYYEQAAERADVYRRLYDEVLTDPAVAEVTAEVLADLPVAPNAAVDNLRLVVPPSALRGTVSALSRQITGFLGGDRSTLRLRVGLDPLFTNIADLASIYLAGEVADAPRFAASDVAQATQALLAALEQMANGQPPAAVPTISLTASQVDQISALLLDRLGAAERAQLADQVTSLLQGGDLPAALALVGPVLFQGDDQAIVDLRRRLDGDDLDLGRPLAKADRSAGVVLLRTIHHLGDGGVIALAVLAVVTPIATAACAARRTGQTAAGAARLAALGALAGGTVALLIGTALPTVIGDPVSAVTGADSAVPATVRALLADIQGSLLGRLREVWLWLAAAALLIGLGTATASLLVGRLRSSWSGRRVAALVLGGALAFGAAWPVLPLSSAGTPVACNGSRDFCELRYDEAVYPASHNAMASNAARFVGAVQDPDLSGQLDTGVRALLLDVHHWTTPEDVRSFLDGLEPAERSRLEPYTRGARSSRSGLWLCHSVCQLGAVRLDSALNHLGTWLWRNPTEVVTLILQDEVPAAEVMAAFDAASLPTRIVTPPPDPDGDWPDLGELVADNRRLVVFAENADVPGTWYRRFFRYAADTPFTVDAPGAFGCEIGRGSEHAAMLLVNHWLTSDEPKRADAETVNRRSSLLDQISRCEKAGLVPTFVAANFTTIGDLIPVVTDLNARRAARATR